MVQQFKSLEPVEGKVRKARAFRSFWELEDGVLTISGDGATPDFIENDPELPWAEDIASIRKIVIEDGITRLGDRAFLGCSALEEVVLPDTLEHIGFGAFEGCSRLTDVKVSPYKFFVHVREKKLVTEDSPDYIFDESCIFFGMRAFRSVPWANDMFGDFLAYGDTLIEYMGQGGDVVIPDDIKVIGALSFESCPLTSVFIPDSVDTIRAFAFHNTGLTDIELPARVKVVESGAFGNSAELHSVTLRGVELDDRGFRPYPWAKVFFGDYQVFCGVLVNYLGNKERVAVPEGVTEIGPRAFADTPVKYVTLPDSLLYIRADAFRGTSIEELTLPVSVLRVESGAFADTLRLKSACILNSATDIAKDTFAGSALKVPKSARKGHYPSVYNSIPFKEGGIEIGKRIQIRNRKSFGDLHIDEAAVVMNKLDKGYAVARIHYKKSEKLVDYVESFLALGSGAYQVYILYPCGVKIKGMPIIPELYADKAVEVSGEELSACSKLGLWPEDDEKSETYFWYQIPVVDKDGGHIEFGGPAELELLTQWLDRNYTARVPRKDTVSIHHHEEENLPL